MIVFGLYTLLRDPVMPWTLVAAGFAISGAVASYLTMNFTGSSTYTSLSGVHREMRQFVPMQGVLVLSGLVLYIISQFK
jgi:hypothetical protein